MIDDIYLLIYWIILNNDYQFDVDAYHLNSESIISLKIRSIHYEYYHNKALNFKIACAKQAPGWPAALISKAWAGAFYYFGSGYDSI